MLLAFSCIIDFKILQMDVKSATLIGYIQDFKKFSYPNHVFNL